ncbi:MAG: hypothetical protein OFPI_14970 [Osedax symbiont Rs2]|nr:MAG: hypothetical protein OFPI_14970 [Osedax symbiont Rs2]
MLIFSVKRRQLNPKMTDLATTYSQLIILNWILSTIIIALISLNIDQYPFDKYSLLWPKHFNIEQAFFL